MDDELVGALAMVEAGDFSAGADVLRRLMPDLSGRARIEGLIGLGRAAMWTERTDEALRSAEEALALADEGGDRELRPAALALLSQVLGQRGDEGDLGHALELGDRALQIWIPGTRPNDLMQHESLHGLTNYWLGRYAAAIDLCRRGEDGATEGLALAGLGHAEAAIDAGAAAIVSAREAGSALNTAYALCCSTAVLRDVLDLDEARRRNQEAIDLYRTIGFDSGVMQGEMDLLYADLTADDVGSADRAWPGLWGRLADASGWERWLAPGRLSVAHAEILARQERWEAAVDAALEAIDVARRIGRLKYDVSARIVLGVATLELGRAGDAVGELRTAAQEAGRLEHPPTRWQAHAALARALAAAGDDDGASAASNAAIRTLDGYVATLTAEHRDALVASPAVTSVRGG